MGKSFKKTPVCGHTGCKSEKHDKQNANRSFRRNSKQKIASEQYDALFVDIREISDNWCFGKDGKSWFGNWIYVDSFLNYRTEEEHNNLIKKMLRK